MSLLDGILSQVGSNAQVGALAARVGLTPQEVEMGLQALGAAHPQPGDTAAVAADNTGLPQDKLQGIINEIGGEGSLGRFAGLVQEANQSGLLGKLEGLGAGFFNRP